MPRVSLNISGVVFIAPSPQEQRHQTHLKRWQTARLHGATTKNSQSSSELESLKFCAYLRCEDVEVQAVFRSRYVYLLNKDASLDAYGGVLRRFSHSDPRFRGLRILKRTTGLYAGSKQVSTNLTVRYMHHHFPLPTEQIYSLIVDYKPLFSGSSSNVTSNSVVKIQHFLLRALWM